MVQYALVTLAMGGAVAMIAASAASAEASPTVHVGRKHFVRCVSCHTTKADARSMTGPHLAGIVGRKVASVEGFAYSDTMRALNFTWDEARLDRFLKSPQADIAGLCLPFTGLPKPEDRAAFIAYLEGPVS